MSVTPPLPKDMPRLGEVDPQTHKLRELHSLHDLPSYQQHQSPRTSSGPLGPVAQNGSLSQIMESFTDAVDCTKDVRDQVLAKIKERPIPSLLFTFGLGAILGMMVSPSR